MAQHLGRVQQNTEGFMARLKRLQVDEAFEHGVAGLRAAIAQSLYVDRLEKINVDRLEQPKDLLGKRKDDLIMRRILWEIEVIHAVDAKARVLAS